MFATLTLMQTQLLHLQHPLEEAVSYQYDHNLEDRSIRRTHIRLLLRDGLPTRVP